MRNETYPPRATLESTWAIIQENSRYIKKMQEENQKVYESIKAMQQEIGGIANSNGEVAESYFVNSFFNSMFFGGQEYDTFDYSKKRKSKRDKLQGEYDIVMRNCNSIAIIEIKYKAREKDFEQLMKQPSIFKQLHPEYANFDIYLGLAAFHFDIGVEEEIIKQGIAVVKQVGDSVVINDEHLKVF